MHQSNFVRADLVEVRLQGQQASQILGLAAEQGIRLRQVRAEPGGLTAQIGGRDLTRLQRLAVKWQTDLTVLRRKGPGRMTQRLARRPGLLAGAILFCLMVWWLSGYVWRIDFGSLDGQQTEQVRAILQQAGLCEGIRPARQQLDAARSALAGQAELFGWVGLNFSGGCLYVESTPMARQQIRSATPETALYSAADAQVLAVEVESGFSQVVPGQFVAKGQLLANALRADRQGNPVYQPASGRVMGQVRLRVTADQPLQVRQPVLTGAVSRQQTLYLLGFDFALEESPTAFADAQVLQSWQPLTLGQLSLPGCLHTTLCWERTVQPIQYTDAQAQALARRQTVCRLKQAWPDAQISGQSFSFDQTENSVTCTADFVFTADIARPGVMQPLEPAETS